jgi:hypothetical protein
MTPFHLATRVIAMLLCVGVPALVPAAQPAGDAAAAALKFHQQIKPLLVNYCYDCHGDGISKGKVAFDRFDSDAEMLADRALWVAALKNVRAGLMPADDGPRPTAAEIELLSSWVKYDALGLKPGQPDPGRVVLRRLNRVEYGNTIRDLMGIEFASEVEFPPDDTGLGFDNLGEVLTVSPLLLEKYLQAAEEIVDKAVPRTARVPVKRSVGARDFQLQHRPAPEGETAPAGGSRDSLNARRGGQATHTFTVKQAGTYQLALEANVRSTFDFDTSRATFVLSVDGREMKRQEIAWGSKPVVFDDKLPWTAGTHVVTVELEPAATQLPNPEDPPARPEVTVATAAPAAAPGADAPPAPAAQAQRRPPTPRSVDVRLTAALTGPLETQHWVPPENYRRFFPEDPPADFAARDAYARRILQDFATRAFRRPVDAGKVDQLATIARGVYAEPGGRFEDGIARAMMGVLASPRFLFRLEEPVAGQAGIPVAPIDEFALASRLSYFLWSSMPDAELFALAGRGELRRSLPAQVARMLKDPKSQAFVRNFPGQWLQARDIETVPINARAVLGTGDARSNRASRIDLDSGMRRAMRAETEMTFDYVLREDRSVLELIDSDYTFLNARLATHYGIPGVEGDQLRRVVLPAGSPRGGVLTQGTVLAVTSNPTRTSPVKRGLFILENILGTPPPPAPPDIPPLEDSAKDASGKELPLRVALAQHRSNPLCSSCHSRMDPLGFALENFNAMGNWRDLDASQPIDPAGKLATGEPFADVRELKRILVTDRRIDFYRCLTEKLLTYALGRGLDDHDIETVDLIVARLEQDKGRFSTLLTGVIESVPFQLQRQPATVTHVSPSSPSSASATP